MASVDVTQKIGPLPMWGYGAIIVGGAYAYRYWKGKNTVALDDFSALGVGAGNLEDHIEDTGLDNGGTASGENGGVVAVPDATPASNEQWVSLALDYLISAYGFDRDEVISTLYAYVQGKTLTIAQWGIVTLAKAKYGSPPGGIYTPPVTGGGTTTPPAKTPPSTTPPTTTAPKPAPSGRYVSVTPWPTPLSTLWGIANAYLGNGNRWGEIWNHSNNAQLKALRREPKYIRTGDRFYVPPK